MATRPILHTLCCFRQLTLRHHVSAQKLGGRVVAFKGVGHEQEEIFSCS